MYKTVDFQREELLTKIWSDPLLKIAQSIGISYVALAKTLNRLPLLTIECAVQTPLCL